MVTLGLAMWRGVDEGSAVTAERPPWWEVSVEACPRKSMITVISSSHPAVTQDQVRVSIDLSMSPLSLLVMTDTTAVTAATQSVVVEAPRAGVIAVPENPQATAIADGVIVGVVVAADAVPPHVYLSASLRRRGAGARGGAGFEALAVTTGPRVAAASPASRRAPVGPGRPRHSGRGTRGLCG
ncbi:Protein of unknown function [Gryllus bimaculatus]|nr:Protein of unknown function [Gryllus bimaculatus]